MTGFSEKFARAAARVISRQHSPIIFPSSMSAYLKELHGADVTAIQLIEIVRGGTGKKAKQFENISTYGACRGRPKHLIERLGTSDAYNWTSCWSATPSSTFP